MEVGKRIQSLRERQGLNQKELALRMNISTSVMNRIELGTRPVRDDELLLISKILDISIDELLGSTPPNKKSIKIPVYASVAAGCPILTNDEIIDYEEIPIEWENQGEFFGVKVKGDSMFPNFLEGDTLIVRKQNDVDNGELGIVLVNGDEATFKKIEKIENGLILIPLNSANYAPKVFSPKDIEELPVMIIGKVVELRRAF